MTLCALWSYLCVENGCSLPSLLWPIAVSNVVACVFGSPHVKTVVGVVGVVVCSAQTNSRLYYQFNQVLR